MIGNQSHETRAHVTLSLIGSVISWELPSPAPFSQLLRGQNLNKSWRVRGWFSPWDCCTVHTFTLLCRGLYVVGWRSVYILQRRDGLSKGRVERFRHAKVLIRVQLVRASGAPWAVDVGARARITCQSPDPNTVPALHNDPISFLIYCYMFTKHTVIRLGFGIWFEYLRRGFEVRTENNEIFVVTWNSMHLTRLQTERSQGGQEVIKLRKNWHSKVHTMPKLTEKRHSNDSLKS